MTPRTRNPSVMRNLPNGTVTFLFTDIEGSTGLLYDLGERYAGVLAEHRRTLRDAFGSHFGVEIDTEGDAFFVAFQRASDALAAAAEAQRALIDTPVKVRCASAAAASASDARWKATKKASPSLSISTPK